MNLYLLGIQNMLKVFFLFKKIGHLEWPKRLQFSSILLNFFQVEIEHWVAKSTSSQR